METTPPNPEHTPLSVQELVQQMFELHDRETHAIFARLMELDVE